MYRRNGLAGNGHQRRNIMKEAGIEAAKPISMKISDGESNENRRKPGYEINI